MKAIYHKLDENARLRFTIYEGRVYSIMARYQSEHEYEDRLVIFGQEGLECVLFNDPNNRNNMIRPPDPRHIDMDPLTHLGVADMEDCIKAVMARYPKDSVMVAEAYERLKKGR